MAYGMPSKLGREQQSSHQKDALDIVVPQNSHWFMRKEGLLDPNWGLVPVGEAVVSSV